MLTELEKKLNEHGENFSKTRKYKKEPVRIEEYNNQNKKYLIKYYEIFFII